jgi:hypothetical protein
MTYMWHISIGYQNNHKIFTINDKKYIFWLMHKNIYVDHRPHSSFDDVNVDVMLHVSMVVCGLMYAITWILFVDVTCDFKIIIKASCNF